MLPTLWWVHGKEYSHIGAPTLGRPSRWTAGEVEPSRTSAGRGALRGGDDTSLRPPQAGHRRHRVTAGPRDARTASYQAAVRPHRTSIALDEAAISGSATPVACAGGPALLRDSIGPTGVASACG